MLIFKLFELGYTKCTEADKIFFHSKKETNYYITLKVLQGQGIVKMFEQQLKYKFSCDVKYIADFVFTLPNGAEEIRDDTFDITDVFKLKKKLMKHEFGIDVKVV